jgi:hypothetical protein
MRLRLVILLATALLAGCDGNEEERTAAERASPPPPPDAGTATGHGADDPRVAVPDLDGSPPSALVVLAEPGRGPRARSAQPGGGPGRVVALHSPSVVGTTTGRDPESGVPRVRVSLREHVTCRLDAGGTVKRQRVRYFPPPQIERIRSAPGARIAVTARRRVTVPLARSRCPLGARAARVQGEVWGEAINGLGLEAVTPHIHFVWRHPQMR